jgi:hypothetical protein
MASPGTAFRRLQQRNTRGHHYTECADDFHTLILRLNAPSGKYCIPTPEQKHQACFSGTLFASLTA